MRKVPHCIFSLLIIITLSGCAAISKEECLLGDWYQVGLSDGQQGVKNKAATYHKECSKYQAQVDVKRYNDGRNEGLKSFCTYQNGVSHGMSNKTYNNVCPTELSAKFLFGYTPYHNLAQAESELNSSEMKISRYVERLGDKNISANDRNSIKSSLKEEKSRLTHLESKVRSSQNEVSLHKIQVEKIKINNELSEHNLSKSRKNYLTDRLRTLSKQEAFYTNLSQAEGTIRSIKAITDLF